MTSQTLVRLIRARYRLQWAKVRGSSLNIAFFLAAQGLVLLLVLFTASSGLAGAAVAVRLGRAELVARTILGAVFLNSLLASILMGFGMTQVFSDAVLRRYPLSSAERFVTRQLLAFFEPLWLFTIALYLGAAIGFWAMGAAPLWQTLPAALLLIAVNYLLARFLVTVIDRGMAAPRGQVVLFLLFNLLALAPMIVRGLTRTPEIRSSLTWMFTLTPPFAAAGMMGGSGAPWHLTLLAGWMLLLVLALLFVESRPVVSRSRQGSTSPLDGLCDRVASILPGLRPPLVSKTLRYFLRHPRVRMQLIVGLLVSAFLVRRGAPADAATTVIGPMLIAAVAGVLPTLEFDTNLFGFESFGTRRLLLLPASPAAVLRAVSLTSLLLGISYSVLVIALWSLVFPAFADVRLLVLVGCGALIGSCLLRGITLWTTVLLPSAADYSAIFRNQASAGMYVVMAIVFALSIAIRIEAPGITSDAIVASWRMVPLVALLCVVFYFACLYGAGAVLTMRRERVLSLVERRS